MKTFTCIPQIKQVAAILMQLYPQYRLRIYPRSVEIIFNSSYIYKFSVCKDGFLEITNQSSHRGTGYTVHFFRYLSLINKLSYVPDEEDLYLKVCEECQKRDIEKDIKYFDDNYMIYYRAQLCRRRRTWINTILILLSIIGLIGFAMDRKSPNRGYIDHDSYYDSYEDTVSQKFGIKKINKSYEEYDGIRLVYSEDQKITEPIFDHYPSITGYLGVVKQGNHWCFIDTTGKVLCKYSDSAKQIDLIHRLTPDIYLLSTCDTAGNDCLYGAVNQKGKYIVPCKYKDIGAIVVLSDNKVTTGGIYKYDSDGNRYIDIPLIMFYGSRVLLIAFVIYNLLFKILYAIKRRKGLVF